MRVSSLAFRGVSISGAVGVLAVAGEVLWAYPWLAWIGRWDAVRWARPPLSLASVLALAVAVEVIARFTLGRGWPLRYVRLLVLAVAVALLAVLVRLGLGGNYSLFDTAWGRHAADNLSSLAGALAFGTYVIWRAISTGREHLAFEDLYRKFLLGLGGLVALFVLWGATSRSGEFRRLVASAGLYGVAYFALGLLALALVNLQSIREEMVQKEGASRLMDRRWLSLLLGTVLAIVGVSLALASVLSLDLAALLLHPLNVLANWLLVAFIYVVGYPLGVVAAILIYILRFLVHLAGGGQRTGPLNITNVSDFLSDLQKASQGQEARGIPPEAAVSLKWVFIALVTVAVLLVLARALFRYWKGKPEEVEEVSESLWTWQVLRDDIFSILRGLLQWLGRWRPARKRQAVPPPAATVEVLDETQVFSIRELYQALLWEGRGTGQPRKPSETPYEYENRLESALDVPVPGLQAITSAYVAYRYGGIAAQGEQLVTLNRLWRQVRMLLRRGQQA